MNTEEIRAKFEDESFFIIAAVDDGNYSRNYAGSKQAAFEQYKKGYQQAVKDIEAEIVGRSNQLRLAKASTYHNEMGKLLKKLFGVDYNCQRENKYAPEAPSHE